MRWIIKKIVKKIVDLLPSEAYATLLDLFYRRSTAPRQLQFLLKQTYTNFKPNSTESEIFDEVGFNLYSQTYEDGILLYVFSKIGTSNQRCVDIGAGTINGSNVANLIINHSFSGLLIDGNSKHIREAEKYYMSHPETYLFSPKLVCQLVTAENVDQLLNSNGFAGEIDLLGIDIDGIDYWIWDAIEVITPRVVVVEYNCLLGPDRAWSIPYKPDFDVHDYSVNHEQYNYSGASLNAFVKLGRKKGYRLVGCNKGGGNAFFIKNAVGEESLPEITTRSCFKYDWNKYSMEKRFTLIKDMEWIEV